MLPPLLQRHFAAAIALLIDVPAGRLISSRAGTPPPILINSRGQSSILDQGGLPLSLDAAESYASEYADFKPGDLLVLCTDGLTETANTRDEEFGISRVISIVSQTPVSSAAEGLAQIIKGLSDFRGAGSGKDDISIVLVRHT